MSKLYATIDSDARKTQATSRGHKWVKVSAQHNFGGGQSADGRLVVTAEHKGDKVYYDVDFIGYTGSPTPIASLTAHPDGSVTKR